MLGRHSYNISIDNNSADFEADKSLSVGIVLSSAPLSPITVGTNTYLYYEVKINSIGAKGKVALGITSNKNYQLTSQPGWLANSYALHGDDGKFFYSGSNKACTSPFKANDIIGVLIDCDKEKINFTRNGKLINNIDGNDGIDANLDWYLIIGLHSRGERVTVHFDDFLYKLPKNEIKIENIKENKNDSPLVIITNRISRWLSSQFERGNNTLPSTVDSFKRTIQRMCLLRQKIDSKFVIQTLIDDGLLESKFQEIKNNSHSENDFPLPSNETLDKIRNWTIKMNKEKKLSGNVSKTIADLCYQNISVLPQDVLMSLCSESSPLISIDGKKIVYNK